MKTVFGITYRVMSHEIDDYSKIFYGPVSDRIWDNIYEHIVDQTSDHVSQYILEKIYENSRWY